MRVLNLVAAFGLTACATMGDDLPTVRYADAASRGSVAVFFAGRPSAADVDHATQNWTNALGDSFACHAPIHQVIDAGLVGALEIAAMNAAETRGGQPEIREGVRRYVGQLASLAVSHRDQPSPARCEALNGWTQRTTEAGRAAVARARSNGLMQDNYGILLDLLGH